MLSGHPHIFTYIFYVIIVYIICYPGRPHMFTYMYIYIYIILSGHPHIHTHIYIYTLNPTTLPLSHHSSNSRLLLLLLAAATPLKRWMEEMQASANVPIRDIYIYIYKVYHLNGIYKIGGKYSHNIFEIYIPDLSYLDWW